MTYSCADPDVCVCRGGGGGGGAGGQDPRGKLQTVGSLSNAGPDPLDNHKAT